MLNKTLSTVALLALPLISIAGGHIGDDKSFSYYHQPGFAVQVFGGIDYAYYTTDHSYVFGFGDLNYTTIESDDDTEDNDTFSPGIFVRKNFPFMDERTVFGIGANYYIHTGKIDGVDISSGSYSVTPLYVGLEYAVSEKFYLWASFKPFIYDKLKLDDGSEVTTSKYAQGGSVQLSYIF